MTGTEKYKCGKRSKHPLGAENGPLAQPGGEEGLQEEMMLEADFQRVSRSYTKAAGKGIPGRGNSMSKSTE